MKIKLYYEIDSEILEAINYGIQDEYLRITLASKIIYIPHKQIKGFEVFEDDKTS